LGACFEVYKEKGCGFLEAVYQECLEIELESRGIPFNSKAELVLSYKGRTLKKRYEPDFICFGLIIMEIKAVSKLTDEDRAQMHNYLRGTNLRLGLLVTSAITPFSNTNALSCNSFFVYFVYFVVVSSSPLSVSGCLFFSLIR
jgi:GxxExxY protein